MTFEWSDENMARAAQLFAAGTSAAAIAAELGCGRNAVIGKMHRMRIRSPMPRGADGRPPTPKPPARPKPNRQTFNARAAAASAPVVRHVPARYSAPRRTRKTLLDLAYGDCRWPCGDVEDPGFFFCGATAIDGMPYCAKHCAIAYRGYRDHDTATN